MHSHFSCRMQTAGVRGCGGGSLSESLSAGTDQDSSAKALVFKLLAVYDAIPEKHPGLTVDVLPLLRKNGGK